MYRKNALRYSRKLVYELRTASLGPSTVTRAYSTRLANQQQPQVMTPDPTKPGWHFPTLGTALCRLSKNPLFIRDAGTEKQLNPVFCCLQSRTCRRVQTSQNAQSPAPTVV